MPTLTISDAAISEINTIGRARSPFEAVGIIAKRRVLELPNRSLSASNEFLVELDDLQLALEVNRIEMEADDWEQVILWHTHPAGTVGPSRTDIRNKRPHIFHLVVALTPQGPVSTFY